MKYIIPVLLLTLPFVLITCLYHTPYPYGLSGKQFLVFYISLSWTVYLSIAALLYKRPVTPVAHYLEKVLVSNYSDRTKSTIKLVAVLCILIGIIRLLQGISNHKPVGHLVVLLLFNLIILRMIFTRLEKK